MSTLKVNAIQNTSGVEQYLCKAWVNFNGVGTPSIRASGNVSSITALGGVSYDINFTSALADTNFSVTGSASDDGVSIPAFGESGSSNTNRTTSKTRVILLNGVTRTSISVAVFR